MKMKFFMLTAIIISSQTYAQQDSTRLLNEVTITANKLPTKTGSDRESYFSYHKGRPGKKSRPHIGPGIE